VILLNSFQEVRSNPLNIPPAERACLESYSFAIFWWLLESKNIYILYTYGKYLSYLENLSIWVLLKNTFDFSEEWRNLLPKRVDILAVFPVHWPWFSSYPFASFGLQQSIAPGKVKWTNFTGLKHKLEMSPKYLIQCTLGEN